MFYCMQEAYRLQSIVLYAKLLNLSAFTSEATLCILLHPLVLTCSPNSVIMLAPTLPALTGFGPLLPGSGGISRESSGRSCDSEEEEDGCGLDL